MESRLIRFISFCFGAAIFSFIGLIMQCFKAEFSVWSFMAFLGGLIAFSALIHLSLKQGSKGRQGDV